MTRRNLRKTALLGSALAFCAMGASAETLRWASTTDPQTMDPHAVNSAPVLSFLNNVYEGLVRRGQDMSIEPSLAASWEPLTDENGWRFNLREGVTFQRWCCVYRRRRDVFVSACIERGRRRTVMVCACVRGARC